MKPRNYKKEYKRDHKSKKSKLDRAARNNARRSVKKLKVGDPREVDHVKSLKKGGSYGKGNLRVTTRAANRKKGSA